MTVPAEAEADDFEFPEVRPVSVVLDAMRDLRDRCAEAGADAIPAMLETALSLMLELRVPRMRENPADLARILDQDHGPGIPAEEAFAQVREHGRRFGAWIETFRSMTSWGRLCEAAMMLLPNEDGYGPSWEIDVEVSSLSHLGSLRRAVLVATDGAPIMAEGTGRHTGAAILGAILTMHLRHPAIWDRDGLHATVGADTKDTGR